MKMWLLFLLKQPGRYASLNHSIYIAAELTPVDVDQHAYHYIVRPQSLPIATHLLQG